MESVSIQLDNGSNVTFVDFVVAAVAPHVHSHGNVVTDVSCVVIAGSKIHQAQVSGQGTRFCSRIVYIYNKLRVKILKIRSVLSLPEASAEEVSVPSYSDTVSGFSSNQLITDSMLESLSPPENSVKVYFIKLIAYNLI